MIFLCMSQTQSFLTSFYINFFYRTQSSLAENTPPNGQNSSSAQVALAQAAPVSQHTANPTPSLTPRQEFAELCKINNQRERDIPASEPKSAKKSLYNITLQNNLP